VVTDTLYTVAEIETVSKKTYPDLLPNQNDILKAITKLHKVTSKPVVQAMQTLYEKGFISYPRSEKRHLPRSLHSKVKVAFDALQESFKTQINDSIIKLDVDNKRIFDDEKVEEHFAVVPWMPKTQNDINALGELERMTYEYVVAKFMMACMQPYEYDATAIVLNATTSDLIFKATGKVEKSKGFKAYNYTTNKETSDIILPKVQEGQKLTLTKIDIKKDTTKPPALLSEADLLDIMENVNKLYSKQVNTDEEDYYSEKFSLGTPATRAQILESVIKTYKYLDYNKKGKLETTKEGKKLLEIIGDAIDLKMTAQFEKDMQKIQKTKSYATIFDQMMEEYVNKIIQDELPNLPETNTQPRNENKTTDFNCPLCDASIIIIETDKTFKCSKNHFKDGKQSGCKFSIFKDQSKFFGRELTSEDLHKLLTATKESPLKENKHGIYINPESQYFIVTAFDGSTSQKKDELIETPKTYRFNDLFIYNNFMYGKITKDEAKKLFNGDTVEFKRKTKDGKEYKVKAKMVGNGQLEVVQ